MQALDLWIIISAAVAASFIITLMYLVYGGCFRKCQPAGAIDQLTILMPFKNEMDILPDRLNRLKLQLHQNQNIELKLINDHSIDLGAHNIHKLETNHQIELINLPPEVVGKKAALSYAIKNAQTDWVMVIDADTALPDSFFLPRAKIIPPEAKCVLIPISPQKQSDWTSRFFDIDFVSLHFAGLASANNNLPLLANGACMLICRKAYLKTINLRNDWSERSGDDVFSMFAIAEMYGRQAVKTLNIFDSPASVNFPNGFVKLWNQRVRWISKTGQIKNRWFRYVSILVLLTQIVLMGNVFLMWKYPEFKAITFITLAIILTEIVYLAIGSARLHRKDLWMFIIPASFIYPTYLLSLLIFSTLASPKWK